MCYDYLGRRSVLFGYCIELNEIVDIKKCLYYEEKRWHNTRSKREGSESKATNSEDGESEDYDSEDYEFDHEEGLDSDQKYLIEKRLNEAWEKFIKNNQALFERFPINGLGFTIFYQARSASYECAPIDDAKLIWGYDLDNVKIDKEQKDESASLRPKIVTISIGSPLKWISPKNHLTFMLVFWKVSGL